MNARKAICELPLRLAQEGYGEYVCSFLPIIVNVPSWREKMSDAPSRLQPLLRLFLLGDSVDIGDLPGSICEIVPMFVEAGVLWCKGEQARTPGLSLLPVLGRWLFSQQTTPNPSLYFGDDSLALLHRLAPRPAGHTLDLCSGPGIQSLFCAGISARVTAVELNPVAHGLARVNTLMNRLEKRIDSRQGNLYAAVPGCRFDHIVANPPLLPLPAALKYPFVGHGGEDGLRVTWRILTGLREHLVPGGIAQIIGTCLSDGLQPAIAEPLAHLAKACSLNVTMTITSHRELTPGSLQFSLLAATATAAGASVTEATELLRTHFATRSASHLCFFYMLARHGRGTADLMDLSTATSSLAWYS